MALNVGKEVAAMQRMTVKQLRERYAEVFGDGTRTGNKIWLIKRIAWRMQANEEGDLSERARRRVAELANDADLRMKAPAEKKPAPAPRGRKVQATISRSHDGRIPMPGTVLTRRYKGETVQVTVLRDGFEYEGEVYPSLSAVEGDHGLAHQRVSLLPPERKRRPEMRKRDNPHESTPIRCAIYTRKSTEEGLDQEFNTLDAQRESREYFIRAQEGDGWGCLPMRYDDGGFTGGNMERPALRRLLEDIQAGKVDCVVVYKVDRLSRSLLDFARIMETFEAHGVSFVSVTQQFNTTSSMGRLMLNVLLSFAQFEREIISERTRDKMAAARRKGKYVGGMLLLGYT